MNINTVRATALFEEVKAGQTFVLSISFGKVIVEVAMY